MEYPPPAASPQHSRKQSSTGYAASPSSDDDGPEGKRLRAGAKRACNECRQQKLRCEYADDNSRCARCNKQNLDCRFDSNFKRVGKRTRHAEMEQETVMLKQENKELRARLAVYEPSTVTSTFATFPTPTPSNGLPQASPALANAATNAINQYADSHGDAVASLMDLKSGHERFPGCTSRSLESIAFTPQRIDELFNVYFHEYHPFLPVLDPSKSPDNYYELSTLLYWTIVVVASRRYAPEREPRLLNQITEPYTRLLWSQISKVPQSHHDVRALALICTWPLSCSTTSSDSTFLLSGCMMKMAQQIGLHRPTHPLDFNRTFTQYSDEEITEKLTTWALCNIVAQTVSTSYGQPPDTTYDMTLFNPSSNERLAPRFQARLEIERLANKITNALYVDEQDEESRANGRSGYPKAPQVIRLLASEIQELEIRLNEAMDDITYIYFTALSVHLRLYVFFVAADNSTLEYGQELMNLSFAVNNFLQAIQRLQGTDQSLKSAPNYIMWLLVAIGFAAHKLINSDFAALINAQDLNTEIFPNTVRMVREMSVTTNDLPQRLMEVLVQLYQGVRSMAPDPPNKPSDLRTLQLEIHCRFSMSHVYDALWRWRKHVSGIFRKEKLAEAVQNPSEPNLDMTQSPTLMDHQSTDQQQQQMMPVGEANVPQINPGMGLNGLGGMSLPLAMNVGGGGTPDPMFTGDYVFDSLAWVFDGGIGDFGYPGQGLDNVTGNYVPLGQ